MAAHEVSSMSVGTCAREEAVQHGVAGAAVTGEQAGDALLLGSILWYHIDGLQVRSTHTATQLTLHTTASVLDAA